MTREIKFRGKRLDNGEWVYGGIAIADEETVTIIYRQGINLTHHTAVDPVTVGQLTGLKDKNGKEIYEGDIIEHNGKKFVCKWTSVKGFCFVEINKNLGSFAEDGILMNNHNNRGQYEIYNYLKYCEVIGNIHENPELLPNP